MSREDHERPGTADLLGRNDPPPAGREPMGQPMDPAMAQRVDAPTGQPQAPMGQPRPAAASDGGQLAALFPPEVAADFRSRWDQVQIGFVDDPQRAVQQADELVAEVMRKLAARFADQRARLEAGLQRGGDEDTEGRRMALHEYRSFFQRLLSL